MHKHEGVKIVGYITNKNKACEMTQNGIKPTTKPPQHIPHTVRFD
jgi:hypothetical protein